MGLQTPWGFTVGQEVQWSCKPHGKDRFIAKGIIRKLYETNIDDAIQRVARIEVTGEDYKWVFPTRKHTTILLRKLSVVKR